MEYSLCQGSGTGASASAVLLELLLDVDGLMFDNELQQDNVLSDYFAVKCFHEDWGVGVGLKVLYCYTHLYPEKKGQLPRAAKCLRTWAKLRSVREFSVSRKKWASLKSNHRSRRAWKLLLEHNAFDVGCMYELAKIIATR